MGTAQMLGVILQWTSIQPRGSGNSSCESLYATETGDKRRPNGPLGSYVNYVHNLFVASLLLLVNEKVFWKIWKGDDLQRGGINKSLVWMVLKTGGSRSSSQKLSYTA